MDSLLPALPDHETTVFVTPLLKNFINCPLKHLDDTLAVPSRKAVRRYTRGNPGVHALSLHGHEKTGRDGVGGLSLDSGGTEPRGT